MKSLLRGLLVGALLFALSGMVSAAEDVTGFKGYTWGTDFETIHQEKELSWFKNNGKNSEIGEHIGIWDTQLDAKKEIAIMYNYGFYKNKLVSGMIIFYDQTRYFEAVKLFEDKYGKHQRSNKGINYYTFDSATISINSEMMVITFLSNRYVEDAIKREKEAEKAKKDKEFDRLFN